MHANLPEIAKRWERDYANGGISRIPVANGSSYKQNILDQYQNIASQYNQPVTYTDSPVFQAGFEKWNPYGIGSYLAQGAQKAKSALGLNTAATAAPFGGGMYVPPKEDAIAEYSKYISDPETATALGESDWATQFGHETSHLGWEYENLAKQLASISPHLKTSASNPSYAGEEQWNYMNDLMYGPRYDEDVHGRPGEDYLTTKGLINKGDLSYTPEAFDVIAKSGLITPHKRAIGFGKNPHEDTMMGKMRSYPNRSIPEDKIKAMRQDLKSVPAHMRRRTSFPNTAQKFANLDNFTRSPHQGFKEFDKWGNKQMALENPAKDPYEKPSGLMQFKDWATDKLGTGVNWGKAALSGIGNAIMPGVGWALGAINPGKLRGYNYGQDRYNTQAEYEANRSARRHKARIGYMMDRRAAGKGFSQANLNKATMGSKPGYYGNVWGGEGTGMTGGQQIAGAPANLGQSVHGKGFGRDHAGTGGIGSAASKGKQQRGGHHFNRGGIAGLWPR